jgi:ABC-2 type transport system permease protein
LSSIAARSQREGGMRRVLVLARTLAVAEFKLRYLDARLSYCWCVMRPLAFFAVLYIVFTRVGHFNRGVPHYGVCLLTSLVLWTFFAESTATAVGSLVRRHDLLRKVAFPRMAVPLSVTLTSLFDLAMSMIALAVFIFVSGVTPRLSWLELPLLLFVLALLIAGLSMLLSVLYVRFRDVDDVWLVVRQSLFYATPVLYVASSMPAGLRRVVSLSPLAAIFTEARRALVDPTAPSAASAVGGVAWLIVPAGIVAVVFAAGVMLFEREGERVAEIL